MRPRPAARNPSNMTSNRCGLFHAFPSYSLDAKLLAQLHRTWMIAESYVAFEELRDHRAFVRGRKQSIENRKDSKTKSTPSSARDFLRLDSFSVEDWVFLTNEDLLLSLSTRQPLDSFLAVINEPTA